MGREVEDSFIPRESLFSQSYHQPSKGKVGAIFLVFIVTLTVLALFWRILSPTGFVVFDKEVIEIPVNSSWNLSLLAFQLVQGETVYTIENLSSYVSDTTLVIPLSSFSLYPGEWTGTILENGKVIYSLAFTVQEAISLSEDDSAEVLASSSGWFVGNQSLRLEVDHAIIEPSVPYKNTTIQCSNGSVSSDVTTLYYLWYVNNTLLGKENRTTLGSGNFSVGDRVACGIAPQASTFLAAYWPLDEGRSDIAYEIVNNMSGQITNPLWVSGRLYYALSVNSTRYVTVINPQGLNLSRNFTYEIWFYPTEISDDALYQYGNFTIHIRSGRVRINFPIDGNLAQDQLFSSTTPALNAWHHLAVTYDNSTLILYLDGALNNQTNISGQLGGIQGNITFGVLNNLSEAYVGYIDDIAVFNGTLTANEILDHYQHGFARLSRDYSLMLDTNVADFANGTCAFVDCSNQSGNVTLLNSSGSAFYTSGNFTSRIFERQNWEGSLFVFWHNSTPSGTNLSIQVRTGERELNGSFRWSSYAGPDPTMSGDRGLLFALDFDERDSNVTIDNIGKRNISLAMNSIIPEGRHGTGLSFPGVIGLSVADDLPWSLVNKNNYSLELWAKPFSVTTAGLLVKGSAYQLAVDSTGKVVYNATHTESGSVTSTSTLTAGEWAYVVVTFDAQNSTKMYINGVLENQATINGTMSSDSSVLLIGDLSGSGNEFNGTMDSIAVYNRTLSEDEVKRHYSDKFTNSSGGETFGTGKRYLQYKALFETNSTSQSPTLYDVALQPNNFSAIVYNHQPNELSITGPGNNTILSGTTEELNWSMALDLENNASVFYEFILANDSAFTQVQNSRLAINNFSETEAFDDNYTVLVEHFSSLDDLRRNGFVVLVKNTREEGRWGNGFLANGTILQKNLTIGSLGTIEVWVRPVWSPNNNDNNVLFHQEESGLLLNRSRTFLSFNLGPNSPQQITYNISTWNANEWHHVAMSWNRENLSLFIDGSRVNRTSLSSIASSTGRLYIGLNSSLALPFNGTIDELRISNMSRESTNELNTTNLTITPGSYWDGTYYWRVRAGNTDSKVFDGQTLFTQWKSRAVRFDTRTPTATPIVDPVKLLSELTTDIQLNTSEPATCQYRQYHTTFSVMNSTGSLVHSQTVNLPKFGNFTYVVQCTDARNLTANTSISFYVFDKSEGTVLTNTTTYSFVANQTVRLNFTSSSGLLMGGIELTTRNNVTGQVHIIKHTGAHNPENGSVNLQSSPFIYHTYLFDEDILRNLSGNITVQVHYSLAEFGPIIPGSERIQAFNLAAMSWDTRAELINLSLGISYVNTTSSGTFLVTGEEKNSSASSRASNSVGGLSTPAKPAKEEFPYSITLETGPITAGVERYISVYDAVTGVTYLYLLTNNDIPDASIIIQRVRRDDLAVYSAFTIESLGISDDNLDKLVIGFGVSKIWLETIGQTSETISIRDVDGNIYPVTLVDEDEDFYYFESETNGFGMFFVFSSQTEPAEVVLDKSNETISSLFGNIVETGKAIIESETGSVVVSTTVASGGLLYLSRIGLLFFLVFRRRYTLKEEDLKIMPTRRELMLYAYLHRNEKDIHKLLRSNGAEENTIAKVLVHLKKIPQSKLNDYIASQLYNGAKESCIVRTLTAKGWKENEVRDGLRKFTRL